MSDELDGEALAADHYDVPHRHNTDQHKDGSRGLPLQDGSGFGIGEDEEGNEAPGKISIRIDHRKETWGKRAFCVTRAFEAMTRKPRL